MLRYECIANAGLVQMVERSLRGFDALTLHQARLAQLVRAAASKADGCGFESRIAHQILGVDMRPTLSTIQAIIYMYGVFLIMTGFNNTHRLVGGLAVVVVVVVSLSVIAEFFYDVWLQTSMWSPPKPRKRKM
jgi:hypothetical protein